MGRLVGTLAVLGGLVWLPTTAFAQATIAGTAHDASGGVLSGVTIEAASPVLTEKSRTTVTDGNGQFQITDLPPGTYTVTFTLAGFNTRRREAIELAGSPSTAVVDAELFAGSQGQPETTGQPDKGEGYKFLVRGFIATQFDYDEHDMGGTQLLLPPPEPLPSTLRFSANQTQLGFGLETPAVGGLTNKVYVEIDFLSTPPAGADRLTTRDPRMRQAFWMLGLSEDRHTILVGQAPVIFGDLVPNITWDNLALTLGALSGREPQVRYTLLQPRSDVSALSLAVSVNAPNSGLLSENTGTAERSDLPSVQAKLAYFNAGRGTVNYFGFEDVQPFPAEIAVSGFLGAEEIDPVTGGNAEEVVAGGVAVSAVVPIVGIRDINRRAGAVGLIAQGWIGQNLDAYFGSNGQGIYETAAGEVAGVDCRGFFAGVNAFVSQNIWLSAFYAYESNDLGDLADAGTPFRIASGLFSDTTFGSPGVGDARDVYVAVWFNPLTSLYTSVGWDHREASYNDGRDGENDRFNLSVFYNFTSAPADRVTKLPWATHYGGRNR